MPNVTNALKILPEKWRGSEKLNTFGGDQVMTIINEAGLYKLIMRSNKPIAEKFQEVVCEEILPSIRKTGEFKLQTLLQEKDNEIRRISEEKDNEIGRINEEKEEICDVNELLTKEKESLEKKYIKPSRITVDGKNVVYLMTTDDAEKRGEYAIGKSFDLSNRKYNYDCNKIHDFKVVYYVSCKSYRIMDLLEAIILTKLNKYKCKANRDVFLLPESQDISLFTNVFDDNIIYLGDVEPNEVEYTTRSPNRIEYYEDHRDEILEKQKEFRDRNLEPFNQNRRILNIERSEVNSAKCKKYYEENRENVIAQVMEHYQENREVILEERKEFYEENKEVILEERKDYYKKNYDTKIAPQREALELCECGMTISHYGMKKHKKSASHLRLIEKKNNPDVEDDTSSRTNCVCGMIVSTKNLPRHTNSDRHKRLMQKLEEKTK